jgi:hypothetical protein
VDVEHANALTDAVDRGPPRAMPCRSSRVQGPAIMYATKLFL